MIKVRALGWNNGAPVTLAPVGIANADGFFRWGFSCPSGAISHPIAADLKDIALAIHLADRTVRRSMLLGRRMRRIELRIPVREPERWRRVASLLQELACFASADEWKLKFSQAPGAKRSNAKRQRCAGGDVVALFSGGLDSLCGACYLARRKAKPLFVTHSPPGRDRTENMLRDVWTAWGRTDFDQISCVSCRLDVRERGTHGERSMFHEQTRRTRPFYFLSLACAVAIEFGVNRVQMSENGALALSLPFRSDAYGGAIARQAHSFMLRGFAGLLDEVIPRHPHWEIYNPFEQMTKGEACALLGLAESLSRRAISCEYVGRKAANVRGWKRRKPRLSRELGTGPQCGLCVPCIARRAALLRAGIADPDEDYFFDARKVRKWQKIGGDPFGVRADNRPPLYEYVSSHVLYLHRFCTLLGKMGFGEFATRYLTELRFCQFHNRDDRVPREQFKLMLRFSHEVLTFLELYDA